MISFKILKILATIGLFLGVLAQIIFFDMPEAEKVLEAREVNTAPVTKGTNEVSLPAELAVIKNLFRNANSGGLTNKQTLDEKGGLVSLMNSEPWIMLGLLKGDNRVKGYIMQSNGSVLSVSEGEFFGDGLKVLVVDESEIVYELVGGERKSLKMYKN